MASVFIPSIEIDQDYATLRVKGYKVSNQGGNSVAIVDLDKLAEFLAKHLDIKPEKLINLNPLIRVKMNKGI